MRALHEMSLPGGPIASEDSALTYQTWVKPFFVWLAGVDPQGRIGSGAAPLGPELFKRWKAHLDARVAVTCPLKSGPPMR